MDVAAFPFYRAGRHAGPSAEEETRGAIKGKLSKRHNGGSVGAVFLPSPAHLYPPAVFHTVMQLFKEAAGRDFFFFFLRILEYRIKKTVTEGTKFERKIKCFMLAQLFFLKSVSTGRWKQVWSIRWHFANAELQ